MSRVVSLVLVASFLAVSLWPSHKAAAKLTNKLRPNHTSKLTAPMNVRVELVGPKPTQTGDTYDLVGIVSSGKALKGVRLQWELGAVATLVAGALSQTIDLEPGKEVRMQIQVRAMQLGSQQVRLTASMGSSEAHLSSSGRLRPPKVEITESSAGKKQDAALPIPGSPSESKKKPKSFQ